MVKGAYTLSKSMNESDNDGRTGARPGSIPYEQQPQLGGRRIRSHATTWQLGFVYQLPWQNNGSGYSNIGQAILGDWQLNGVALARSAARRSRSQLTARAVNTPGTQADRQSQSGEFKVLGGIGGPVSNKWFDTTGSHPADRRHPSATRDVNQFRGPGAWNVDFALFRNIPVWADSGSSSSASRGNNILNHPVFANPAGRHHRRGRLDRSPASWVAVD